MPSLATIEKSGVLINDFSKGRVSRNLVSPWQSPVGSVSDSFNVNFDIVIGSAKVRPGTTLLGSQVVANKLPLGLNSFVGPGGSPNILVGAWQGASKAALYYFNGSAWAESGLTTLNNVNPVRFATLGGRCYMVNGEQTYSSADGNTWNFTNCPNYDNTGGLGSVGIVPTSYTGQTAATYASSNVNGSDPSYKGHYIQRGECFSPSINSTITSCTFNLSVTGSPPATDGTYVMIYNASGALGSTCVPVGSPIATSDPTNISSISSSFSDVTYTFSGTNQIVLNAGQNYAIVVQYAGGSSSNYISVGEHTGSSGFTGNAVKLNSNSTWSVVSNETYAFALYANQALVQSGSNYLVNDVLTVSGGSGTATLTVTSISASGGAVTGVSITVIGSGYSVANQVSVTGGTGSGFLVNILSLAGITSIFPTLIFKTKGVLLLAGDPTSRDTVYFSSVIDPTLSPPIVWNTDPTNGNWIRINPDDGGNVTAFAECSTSVLVFKNTGMYRLDSIAKTTDPDLIFPIGCYSQENVVTCQDKVYYFGGNGIYSTDSTFPVLISRESVNDFIQTIPQYYWPYVTLGADDFNVYVSIGNVTVNGTSYNNVVLKYSTLDTTWSVHYYANQFRLFTQYTNIANGRTIVGADINGNVQTLNLGQTDNGTPIFAQLDTQELDFGMRAILKKVSQEMVIFSENAKSFQIQAKCDDDDWKDVKVVLDKKVKICKDINLQCYYAKFRWSGVSTSDSPILTGFYFDKVDYVGVTEK